MNRFNLTFSGEILPGHDPERVKAEFGELFHIDDPARIDKFFQGRPVTLRRDLDRKAAATLYAKLHQSGADVALEKVVSTGPVPEPAAKAPPPEPPPEKAPDPEPVKKAIRHGMDQEIREAHPGRIDQSWPVSFARISSTPESKTPPAAQKSAATQRILELEARLKREDAELEAKRKVEEEAARKRAAELAAKRKAEEEAARKKAVELEARRRAEEEAARKRTAELEAKRKAEEEAARKKAVELEARRRAEEEAARKRAAELAAKHKAEEEAARKKAVELEARRRAEEEAARKRAAELEAKRKAEEEAARKRAAELEARRKAEEEAARKKAAELEARRRAEEEAARKRAAELEARRKAEEEAARKKAAELEAKRRAEEEAARSRAKEKQRKAAELAALKARQAEEAVREKALKLEAKRKAAEEEARAREEEKRKKAAELAEREARKAREAAREKLLQQEARREAAEKAAALRAEKAEQKRKASEERARLREEEDTRKAALKLEKKRRAAEESARQLSLKLEAKRKVAELAAEQKRKHAEEFSKLKEQKAAVKAKRKAQEKAARERAEKEAQEMAALRAEQHRLEALAAAREKSERLARLKPRRVSTEKSTADVLTQASTSAPAGKKSSTTGSTKPIPHSIGRSKSTRSQVKTTLRVPRRDEQAQAPDDTPAKHSRQPDAPNFFKLRPFRTTKEMNERSERSTQVKQVAFSASLITLVVLIALSLRLYILPEARLVTGANAIVANQNDELLLSAGGRFFNHDRAGVGSGVIEWQALGLIATPTPLAFTSKDEIVLLGQLAVEDVPPPGPGSIQLLRCKLDDPACTAVPMPEEVASINGAALNPLTGDFLIADAKQGKLFKISADGELLGQSITPVPDRAVLRLQDGLLYINSPVAPAVSVFRHDDRAFGEQLDEILLIPSPALQAGQSRVADFIWSAGNWWATLYNPDSRKSGVYRFDNQWDFLNQLELIEGSNPEQLLAWSDKTLVLDSAHLAIARFNAQGVAEVPLISDSLQAFIEGRISSSKLSSLLWRLTLGLLSILALASLGLGMLYRLRSLVYRPGLEGDAEPMADREHSINWITPSTHTKARVRQLAAGYSVLCLAILLLAVLIFQSPLLIFALVVWMSGPPIALYLLHSTSRGHIGVLDDQLVLVDHNGLYHMGRGPRVLYRDYFLLVDDIVVFTGTPFFPVFDRDQMRLHVIPLAEAGIKIDRKTVLIKLLEGKHPLTKGLLCCIISTMLAGLILLM